MEKFLLTFYNDFFTLSIYIISLISVILIKFNKNTKENSIFTCEKIFIMFYYVFIAIGPIFLVLFRNYTYNYNIFFIFLFALIAFLVGADFIARIKVFTPKKKRNFKILNLKDVDFTTLKKNATIVLIISYIFASYYILKNIGYLLLDFENNRVSAMSGSGIIIHFSYLMLPATWILYYCHLNYRRNKFIYVFFIIDICLLLLIGFRSRILELILLSIIIRNDYESFKIKKLAKYGIFLIIFVVLLQTVRTVISGGSIESTFNQLVITLSVGSINLKSIFSAFPRRIGFQHGYTYLINLYQLTPYSSLDVTMWLKEKLNMTFAGGGITPTILGEFYINFGYISIFLGMMILGILARRLDNLYKENKGNKIIYFIFAFYIARSVSSGLANFLILVIWFSIVSYFMFKVKT